MKKGENREDLKMAVLMCVFFAAVYMDLHFYKIPNLCILTGILSGLIMTYGLYSFEGILRAVAAAGLIFAGFYPFYLMGGLGAGDVKLLMITGFFIHDARLLAKYLFATFALAAIICAVKMILFAESRKRIFYLGRYLKKAALTGIIDNYIVDKENKKCVIRLSIPAFVSLAAMWMGVY